MDLLKQASECFKSARTNVIEGMFLLAEIEQKELYKGKYETIFKYAEEECDLAKGTVSKYLAIVKGYTLGGVSQRNLEGVDTEKLYLSLSLEGTAEEKLAQAKTLSRDEIKENIREDKHGVCSHEGKPFEVFHKCECGKFYKVNAPPKDTN